MNLVLMGLKGVGKSTYGKLLARKIDRNYIDTDLEIERWYFEREKEALTCPEIYSCKGSIYFRKLEEEVILSLQEITKSIIALGGGALLSPVNRRRITEMGTLIYLYLDPKKAKETLPQRPLFLNIEERIEIMDAIPAIRIDAKASNVLDRLEEIALGK